jgi:hypothetical protein|tara:strand:+ start:378 stop:563 length:186 start_codon:yes stop_codon:yes gene_type:complete
MTTLILTIFILVFSIFLLSIGTIFFNNQIKGSCGAIMDDCSCSNTEKIKCKLKIMMDTKPN